MEKTIEALTAEFTEELAKLVRQEVVRTVTDFIAGTGAGTGHVPRKAKTKVNMTCRHPGCKARSKGPRFKYLCGTHLAKPKATKKKAKARKPAVKAKPTAKPKAKPKAEAKTQTVAKPANGATTQV